MPTAFATDILENWLIDDRIAGQVAGLIVFSKRVPTVVQENDSRFLVNVIRNAALAHDSWLGLGSTPMYLYVALCQGSVANLYGGQSPY